MSEKGWIGYWNEDDFWKHSSLWEIGARTFLKNISSILAFNKNDRVLDIGCGVGFIEKALAPCVESVCAADVAKQFVEICAERCRAFPNVSVEQLNEKNYTDLRQLKGPFSIILCVSVVQYYKDEGEIEALIASVKKIASPGARMFMADLPVERGGGGFFWDALCSFLLSVREGYAGTLLRTAFERWLRSSRYKSFYENNRQLFFSVPKLESLINRLELDARVVKGNFSVYANRLGLLIRF